VELDYAQGSPGTFDSARDWRSAITVSVASVRGEPGVSERSVGFAGAMQTCAANRRMQSSRHGRGRSAAMFNAAPPTHP
jgi:hypothetical protein